MDGGSGINILCRDAFDRLKIDVGKLHASQSPFHGIMPGQHVMPRGTIALQVTFGDAIHCRKEILSFEVVDFEGPYHALLGKPCYAKFMAIPNNVYLMLKMTGQRSHSNHANRTMVVPNIAWW